MNKVISVKDGMVHIVTYDNDREHIIKRIDFPMSDLTREEREVLFNIDR